MLWNECFVYRRHFPKIHRSTLHKLTINLLYFWDICDFSLCGKVPAKVRLIQAEQMSSSFYYFTEKKTDCNTGVFLWNLWNSGGYFWKQVTYYYVGHKLVIFNAALFTLLHLLLTRWWDMRLKHDVAWLWEEQTDSRKECQHKKKYCSCCITWMKNGYHFIKNIYNNYQNLLFRKLLAQLGNQTDKFGNFTRLQTYFGRPKPSGER